MGFNQDFRDLLAALNFEASYDATKRELTIRVTLVPELTSPAGGRAPLLFVLLAGQYSNPLIEVLHLGLADKE